VLDGAGVDVDEALAAVATGIPLKTVREEHESAEADHTVWGVPTFIAGGQAAFVASWNARGWRDPRWCRRRAHHRHAHRLAEPQRVQAHLVASIASLSR